MEEQGWDIDACYRRYAPMVYRRCLQLLGDRELAADTMQEVFVRLARSSESVQAPSALLNRIATHACLNALRDSKNRIARTQAAMPPTSVFAQDLEAKVGALRFLDWLFGRELASTRTMAVLHYLDGMTLEEVAQEVGMSVSGVRWRLRLLKSRLRDLEVE